MKEQPSPIGRPGSLSAPKVFVDALTGLDMEGYALSQDDAYQREPSTRAADPISRSLLATAEGHQDYVNKADFFHLYMVNPRADFAICVACLFPPVISWWIRGSMMTAVVILVEASLVLTISWLAWRVGQRDKSAAASTTE